MDFLNELSRIAREISRLNARPMPAVMYYLNESPPYAQAKYPDGTVFNIFPDGSTQILIAGNFFPVPGCPVPEAIFRLNVGAFIWKYRKSMPLAVMCLLGLVALQFLLSTIPGAPGAAWFVDYFAATMNCLIITLAAACLVAFVVRNFGAGITIKFGGDPAGLLESGLPNIDPDVLVMSDSEDETGGQLAERIKSAYYGLAARGQYLLVFTFRHPSGIIVRFPETGSQEVFGRASLTRDIPGWAQEVSDPKRFEQETWTDFLRYVQAFCVQYVAWAKSDKLKINSPIKDLVASMEVLGKKTVSVFLALIISLSVLTAQSARPVPKRFGGDEGPLSSSSLIQQAPDSAGFEAMKVAYLKDRAKEWAALKPQVDFFMWRFEISFLIILVGVGGILWVIASVAARDSVKDIYGSPLFGNILTRAHLWAKGGLFLILAVITVVYLGEAVIRYYYTGGMPTLAKLAKWGVVCYLWYKSYEFVLPDTPNSKPETRALPTTNYPRIN